MSLRGPFPFSANLVASLSFLLLFQHPFFYFLYSSWANVNYRQEIFQVKNTRAKLDFHLPLVVSDIGSRAISSHALLCDTLVPLVDRTR